MPYFHLKRPLRISSSTWVITHALKRLIILFIEDTWQEEVLSTCSLSNPSRAASQTMASNNSGFRVPSIELDVIVEEDPQTRKVSHREQAMLWSLHSPSVDSDKENQLETEAEEGRPGEDEKKAMDEAIERSIDDLVGKFDEVFLDGNADPSSGSSPVDDELEDLVNHRF